MENERKTLAALALIKRLAEMSTPTDGVDDDDEADDIMAELDDETLCSDANTFYELIREAREICEAA